MPGTRFEVIDGKVEYVAPADAPQGSIHSRLSALLEAHVAESHDVAIHMLTRTSFTEDMAPDVSVFPMARDPETGGRQLEDLAFEIVSTERLGFAAKKARSLSARGVRRIFAVDVERRCALAWSPQTDTWESLARDAVIEDRALAVPLPLRALFEGANPDDAIAAALLARRNPVLERALRDAAARGRAKRKLAGRLEAMIESLFLVFSSRGLSVERKAEKQIRSTTDEATLDVWLRRAATATSIDEVLKKGADPPGSDPAR